MQPTSSFNLDLPIAVWKGKRTCTSHPISNYVSYNNFPTYYSYLIASLNYVLIPKSLFEALFHPSKKLTMEEVMFMLHQNST